MKIIYIDNTPDLHTACQIFKKSPFLALDTEFIRQTTYYPQFALLQIATTELAACIDPLAIDSYHDIAELLFDDSITKVFHSSKQDLEIIYHLFHQLPQAIFDTQIAAGLLGHTHQIGYANLVKATLNVSISKLQTRTNWLQRPLTQQQLQYAINDVTYLSQIYLRQQEQLQQLGRHHWLDDDFLLLSNPKNYHVNMDTLWQKVKNWQSLNGVELAILAQLAIWRERQAQQQDKPKRHILTDEILIQLSKKKLNLTHFIKTYPQLIPYTNDIRACIDTAHQLPFENWPKKVKKYLTMQESMLIDTLYAIVKIQAEKYHININNLSTRNEIEKRVKGNKNIPLLKGWRAMVAGDMVENFLQGNTTLSCKNGLLYLNSTTK